MPKVFIIYFIAWYFSVIFWTDISSDMKQKHWGDGTTIRIIIIAECMFIIYSEYCVVCRRSEVGCSCVPQLVGVFRCRHIRGFRHAAHSRNDPNYYSAITYKTQRTVILCIRVRVLSFLTLDTRTSLRTSDWFTCIWFSTCDGRRALPYPNIHTSTTTTLPRYKVQHNAFIQPLGTQKNFHPSLINTYT